MTFECEEERQLKAILGRLGFALSSKATCCSKYHDRLICFQERMKASFIELTSSCQPMTWKPFRQSRWISRVFASLKHFNYKAIVLPVERRNHAEVCFTSGFPPFVTNVGHSLVIQKVLPNEFYSWTRIVLTNCTHFKFRMAGGIVEDEVVDCFVWVPPPSVCYRCSALYKKCTSSVYSVNSCLSKVIFNLFFFCFFKLPSPSTKALWVPPKCYHKKGS